MMVHVKAMLIGLLIVSIMGIAVLGLVYTVRYGSPCVQVLVGGLITALVAYCFGRGIIETWNY